MSQLIEHRSRKAARILDSTRELVLDHGIRKLTVAEIAKAAGVGKGTVYLYWAAKEDLIVGLFAREALSLLDTVTEHLAADHAAVAPRRLAPLLLSTGRKIALVDRLSVGDFDLLRHLAQQSGARELFVETMPGALCEAVMPILHRHGLLRDDRPLPDQSYIMHALLSGFGAAMSEPGSAPRSEGDTDEILADSVARLLEPDTPPSTSAVTSAAEEVAAVMRRTAQAVLDLIERTQVTGA